MKNTLIVLMSLIFATETFSEGKQNAVAPAKPDVLFLLGGQSNMAGCGYTADLPKTKEYEAYFDSPANVSIWDATHKKWTLLSMGKRFGPEIGFAHALSKAMPDKQIGIVKYAKGGTSMDQWKRGGPLYTRLLSDFTAARKSAPDSILAAMLWHQGESDTDKKIVAEAYQSKLIQHIHAIRQDTKEANLLFIYGQINPGKSFCGRPRFKYADIVRNAQEELKLLNTVMIKTDDCEKNAYTTAAAKTPKEKQIKSKEDNLHYSAKGQIKMGVRFAEAYLKRAKYRAE